jgi:hypothetical protein
VQNIANMSTADTPSAAPKRYHFQLLTKLNGIDNAKIVSMYLRDSALEAAIAQLKLENGNKFASLITVFENKWDSASAYLVCEAMTSQQPTKRRTIVQTVAEMLRSLVDKHKSKHPQDVKNDTVRLQHLKTVAGMLVEAVHELATGLDGAFAPALFSASARELVTAQKKRPSENDSASKIRTLEEMCKAKDAEIATLRQQVRNSDMMYSESCKEHEEKYSKLWKDMHASTEEQLRQKLIGAEWSVHNLKNDNNHLTTCLNYYKKKSENNELEVMKAKTKLGGMDEISNRALRAELGEKRARSALEWVREELANETSMRKKLMDGNIEKRKVLEEKVKVAEGKVVRLEKELGSLPGYIANSGNNMIIHYWLRATDAEDSAEVEKRSAEEAKLRYFDVLDRQWEVFYSMPDEVWVLLLPYITLPREDSSLESFHARRDHSTEN